MNSRSLKFSFKFRVSDPDVSDGVLMYAAQSGDGQGDFASVSIKDQHLEFRFDTGSGKEIFLRRFEMVLYLSLLCATSGVANLKGDVNTYCTSRPGNLAREGPNNPV